MDNLNRAGATELAGRICDYWISNGFAGISAIVVPIGNVGGEQVYGVRSNIGGSGFPPRRTTATSTREAA
jgi:hypothetical protein